MPSFYVVFFGFLSCKNKIIFPNFVAKGKTIIEVATLKMTLIWANWTFFVSASREALSVSVGMSGINSNTPKTLSQTWANAASLDSFPPPMEAIRAVIHVPIFAPRTIAIPASSCKEPVNRKLMAIPVIAVLDWIMAVMIVPVNRLKRS